MDPAILSQALSNAGLDKFVPLVLATSVLASALDALIPQPKPGSHGTPLRKLISIAALNMNHATNAGQPTMLSWMQRLAAALQMPPTAPPPAPTV
jgi:hypothetical protein